MMCVANGAADVEEALAKSKTWNSLAEFKQDWEANGATLTQEDGLTVLTCIKRDRIMLKEWIRLDLRNDTFLTFNITEESAPRLEFVGRMETRNAEGEVRRTRLAITRHRGRLRVNLSHALQVYYPADADGIVEARFEFGFQGGENGDTLYIKSVMLEVTNTPAEQIHDYVTAWRPEVGGFADPIPFYWNGEYHVFYLHDGVGNVFWEHRSTKDMVNWTDYPPALLSDGDPKGPDGQFIFTGSVIEKDGIFHIYYTGFNERNPNGREFIMHATSTDLKHFTKHPEDIIAPDGKIYSNHVKRDFRDPYVFWNQEEKCYWMIFLGNVVGDKEPNGRYRWRHGLLTSPDLKTWNYEQPLTTPDGLANGGECPDLFEINGKWYLMAHQAGYFMADNPRGPYYRPPGQPNVGLFWVFVAAKRMFDGKRHIYSGRAGIAFGENPVLDGGEFGDTHGTLREIYAGEDGRLFSKLPQEITDHFSKTVVSYKETDGPLPKRFDVPKNYMVDCKVKISADEKVKLILRTQDDGSGYSFEIDAAERTIEFDGTGRTDIRRHDCLFDTSKEMRIQAIAQGSLLECFIDEKYTLTSRVDTHLEGRMGIEFSGAGVVKTLQVKTP